MGKIALIVVFASVLAAGNGLQPTNYDLSRNRQLGKPGLEGLGLQPNYDLSRNNQLGRPGLGFTLRDIWDFLVGGGYGEYPHYGGNYPSGPGYYPGNQGHYPGNQGHYPGNQNHYPGNHHNPGLVGPPGAHPGCPLCDSSVYSYCSHKQAHDACCCENPAYLPYSCRQSSCRTLYANSCEEYNQISSCCCVDLQKNSIEPVAPIAPAIVG